jgi:hypothetical protein
VDLGIEPFPSKKKALVKLKEEYEREKKIKLYPPKPIEGAKQL